MTLIAISTSQNAARIVTDTWAYTHSMRHMGRTSKVSAFPHLNMAVTGTGSSVFGAFWRNAAAELVALEAATFDDFVQAAPAQLRAYRAEMGNDDPTLIIHVGRSSEAGRYVAVGHSSLDDFEPTDLGDFFVTPAPFSMPPNWYERAQLERMDLFSSDGFQRFYRGWCASPAGHAPSSTSGWVQLAEQVREDRTLMDADSGIKVLVGGELHLTTLDRNGVTARSVHTFNDQGPELLKIFQDSMHPVGQVGPCGCGSGRRFMDCCAVPADKPCVCGSGKLSGECCRLPDDVDVAIVAGAVT
jgi:hypothetical protein